MAKIHTHYDNLKVARNAPQEVIRAAYRTLSQKYHPDKNDDINAQKFTSIINTSYEVLSNPEKRRIHDSWIVQQESVVNNQSSESHSGAKPQSPTAPPAQPAPTRQRRRDGIQPLAVHVMRYWALYLILAVVGLSLLSGPIPPPPGPKPYKQSDQIRPQRQNPAYVRPLVAPNGQNWPDEAGYVIGYQVLNSNGLSSVTIDNSRNDSDVFVKIVSLSGLDAYPVRQMYIPAFRNFTADAVAAGSYDVRYRDLRTGGLSRSESFLLEETPSATGTQYSDMTMTLYKVRDGNMQTFSLAESEF